MLSVLEAEIIKKIVRKFWEWSQQLELAYVDLMGSRKDQELHTKNVLWGDGSETNGMPGEWVKEITGTVY